MITSIALGVVSIQWLLRNQSCDQPRSLRDLQRQLACFLQLLNLNDCGDMVDIKEAAEVGIHEALLLVMSTFSHTARNELFRACLSLYDSSLFGSSISADSSIHCSEDDGMLFTFVYTTMMGICSNDLVDVQFGGLQMVETWLNVVELLEVGSFAHFLDPNVTYCTHLVAKLVSISSLLSSIWSHPSKLINHIVPVVYQRMVEFIAKSAILRHTSDGKFLNELWGTLVSEAFQQPVHHRGRYQALNMLLPKVSAEFIVTSQSNIVKTLIDAVGCRDVSSSSTKLLGTLLRYLRDREGYDAARLRATFDNFAVEALCADLKKTRIASADYLLSELLAVDPECGPHLISCVRRLPPSFRHENKLYGITHITLQCRLLGLSGQGVISGGMDDADSLLTFLELRNLCLARDGDLRLSALFLIVASQKSSAPVVFAEWEVLRDTIFYSLKDGDADHRHRVLRVVKTLCIRVRESLRVAAREGRRAKERSELSTSAESPTLKPSQAELLASAVIDWLRDVCTINTFPGAAFDREIMTLDILSCVLEVADETITGPLLSAPLTSTILNMLLSSWDKSRHLAADVLLKFPRPLPAVISTAEAGLLLGLASALTGSARQRESDAGSQLIRIMFEIYCIDLDWPIHLSLPQSTQQIIYSGSRANARSFFDDMLSILRARLEGVGRLFSSTDRAQEGSNDSGTHLCHGLLLGLRYCMSSISNCLASGERGEVDQWKSLLHRTSELASQAMALGVSVVAEASSDVEFSPHLVINSKSPDTLGSINANSYMFVNTNGHMGAARDDGIESGSSEVQRAVVGAWLMVKESSALLARLVEMSLKLSHDSTEDILTVNEVDDIGQGFTNSLGRLKHMGAISEVHSALQKTAESVIRHGKDRELCALPLKWLQSLLAKLESKEQVFVLRRSSGFAYSFLSLLRAEVFDSKPLLLPVAMKSLLNNAFEGVTFSQSGDGDDAFLEAKDEGWRTCVHALNIIRLMLLDASLGQGIGPYITSCTVIAVTGFKSKRWAVRNSCMMVFAAVVQRAVANEKVNGI